MGDLERILEIPGNNHVLGKLRDLISSHTAVAFVGAGASAAKYPLWLGLLYDLSDLAVERDNAAAADRDYWIREAANDPLGVAQRIKSALGSGIFYSRLEAIFGPPTDGSFTEAHQKLASLPFKGFVTTNYDRGLIDAWQVTHPGMGSKSVATRLNNVVTNRWLTGEIYKQDLRPIFHAHGIIDDPNSLILTLDDYTEAYRTGTSYRRLFERLIIQENLVFIGFGFADPWMFFLSQSVLRDMRGVETARAPRHVAVIGLPNDRQYTREQRRKFEQEYDAEIVFYPVRVTQVAERRREDHTALTALLASLDGAGRAVSTSSPQPQIPVTPTRSAPPFVRRRVRVSQESRFYFGAQGVPLFGRDKAKADLQRFLKVDGGLRWWLVAGPGGIGKSRLALELVESCGSEWDAGFFDQSAGFDWSAWSPAKPTLIVVDYVTQRPRETGDVIRQLYNREDQLSHPVRFLLLERESEGRWVDDFYRTGSSRSLLADCRFDIPLILTPLTPQDLWQVIVSVLTSARRLLPDRSGTLAALMEIDPGGRPLFAAFLADALAAGRSLRQWDRQSLVRDVLAREVERRWQPAGITDQDLNLLALLTMVGGLPVDQATTLGAAGILPDPSQRSLARNTILTGQNRGSVLAPLEPDIIGEMFVLEHLARVDGEKSGVAGQLTQLAWTVSPINCAVFLDRSATDFALHPTLRSIDFAPGRRLLAWFGP
jgi:hypothetical protein